MQGRRVFAAGHYPPPIHGNSVATEQFVAELQRHTEVVRLDIGAPAWRSGALERRTGVARATHQVVRLGRITKALAILARTSRRGDGIYLGCDAGHGMLYTFLVLITARLMHLDRFLHHHSFAYINERSRLMAAVVRGGGPATTHIFTCERQSDRFGNLYPAARNRTIVPITFVLGTGRRPVGRTDAVGAGGQSRRMVLGHLSNLSVAKGLIEVFGTLEAALAAGIDAELLLAGPAVSPGDEVVLTERLESAGPHARHLGPVQGTAKEDFFARIDVFLFPTRYRHESFGIVAAEAMDHGVPVIAYTAGCLDRSWAGGGLVLDHDEPFALRAVELMQAWNEDPALYEAARSLSRSQAYRGQEDGRLAVAALVARLTGPVRR